MLPKGSATVPLLLYCHWISDGLLEKVDNGGKAPPVANHHVMSCLLIAAIYYKNQIINKDRH